MARLAMAEGLEEFRADLGTRPRVHYKHLHRWTKAFVSASVAFGDTDECAEGTNVTVSVAGVPAAEGRVNNYGEFVVDELESGQEYTVTVQAPGYESFSTTVQLEKSMNLGLVLLERGDG